MSRISPFHYKSNESEELANVCPRYIKWTKKVKAFDFSKRKKGKIERSMPSCDLKYKLDDTSRAQKKSKSIFARMRKGGQNLKVRCKTSADLWRRWIRGGIMYNTELNEKDEDLEIQESEPKIVINGNKDSKPIEEKVSKSVENKITEKITERVVIESTDNKTQDKSEEIIDIKVEEKQESIDKSETNVNSNITTSPMPEVVTNND